MVTYKLQKDQSGEVTSIWRSDGWSIPIDEANSDYAEFLRWCSEGNEPLPPDEGESN